MTKYYAQVNYELIAKKEETKAFLKKGYTLNSIYDHFKERKEITCSRASFYRFAKRNFCKKDFIPTVLLENLSEETLKSIYGDF